MSFYAEFVANSKEAFWKETDSQGPAIHRAFFIRPQKCTSAPALFYFFYFTASLYTQKYRFTGALGALYGHRLSRIFIRLNGKYPVILRPDIVLFLS